MMSGSFHRQPPSLRFVSTREILERSLAVTPKPVDKIELCGALRDAMTACAHMVRAVEAGTPIDGQDWSDLNQALFEAIRDAASFRGRMS